MTSTLNALNNFASLIKASKGRRKVVLGLEKPVAAISAGLRCAYLLDTLSLSEDEAELFATSLYAISPDLVVLFEQSSLQVFILNRPLLSYRLSLWLAVPQIGGIEEEEVVWVDVRPGREPEKLARPPDSLLSAITLLSTHLSRSHTFTPHPTPSQLLSISLAPRPSLLPPIAAWLLEYPIGYVVDVDVRGGRGIDEETTGTGLDGRPLWLVEVWMMKGPNKDCLLLSFTHPLNLPHPLLQPSTLHPLLTCRYTDRLKTRGCSKDGGEARRWDDVKVEGREVIVARVVL